MRKIKVFLRTVYLTSVIIICLFVGIFGICKAYEGIRLVGFGEYRRAVEMDGEKIVFFDYEIRT